MISEGAREEVSDTYRILGACLALRVFEHSLADIVAFSGRSRDKCEEVVARYPHFFELSKDGYRLRDDAIPSLRQELDVLYPSIPKRDLTKVEEEGEGPKILELIVAKDILTNRWNQASDKNKRDILYGASLAIRAGCRGVKLYANTVVAIAEVQGLYDQARAELKSKGLL